MTTTFKPHNDFDHLDGLFPRRNIATLIPTGKLLYDFHENDMDDINGLIIKSAIIIVEDGLLPQSHILMTELYPNALVHLEYILSLSVSDFIKNGLGYTEIDFYQWKILLVTYILHNWFKEGDYLKVILYSPRFFSPLSLLRCDLVRGRFETKELNHLLTDYFDEHGHSTELGKRLVDKMQTFGLTSEMLTALTPYPFLNYSPVMDILEHYLHKKTREDNACLTLLITLYFPTSSIKAALSN